jgi:hypothetical protein
LSLAIAFEKTVAESSLIQPVDEAVVEAGRKLAARIDEAVEFGEGPDVTKALYLTPHLLNILRELLATPAARKAAGLEKEKAVGKLTALRSEVGKSA